MKDIRRFGMLVMLILIAVFGMCPDGGAQEITMVTPLPTVSEMEVPTTALPEMPPVHLQDQLRQWAMANVRQGNISVYSQSMDWSYGDRMTALNVTGNSGEQILQALGEVLFKFRLKNPNDAVGMFASLSDGSGNQLFQGSIEVPVTSFEKGVPFIQLWMQEFPILSGVQFAEVLVTGEDGQTVKTLPVKVVDGKVIFQPWLSEKMNGLLSVSYTDGRVIVYNLWTSGGLVPANFSGNSGAGVADHYVYRDPTKIEIRAMYNKPSLFVTMTKEGQVDFDVSGLVYGMTGKYWEYPTSVMDYRGGLYPFSFKSNGVTRLTLPKGIYRLVFGWDQFGKPGMIYTGPDDGGGKG